MPRTSPPSPAALPHAACAQAWLLREMAISQATSGSNTQASSIQPSPGPSPEVARRALQFVGTETSQQSARHGETGDDTGRERRLP